MAAGRDNFSNLGSGVLTRSPIYKNWSCGVLHTSLGSPSRKTTSFAPLATNKMENPFFMWKVENPSYVSCRT
jgi:hypothetical protein